MKTTLKALAVVAAMTSTAQASECYDFFDDYIGPVITARDAGMPPGAIAGQMLMIGMTREAVINIVTMVYVVHKDSDFETIQADYLNFCLGSSA
jgi:hypothetical protein